MSSPNYLDAVEYARKLATERKTINRGALIHLRVAQGERDMLKRVAEEHGETMSSFIRSAALDVARSLIEFNGGEPEA